VALLDVNVMVALFDPDHVHHDVAHDWFAGQREHGWATCPLTENGFLRVLSNPAYHEASLRAGWVADRLRTFRESGRHVFWPDAVSLADERLFDLASVTHRQISDVYLLGLAKRMRGVLATFDRGVPWTAVIGATRASLHVIALADGE
jgi:toxin-antitoxin system PIN domain toxin